MDKKRTETPYEQWMKGEGLPVVSAYGVTDVRALELGPWTRLGGYGAFIELVGLEGATGAYVGEIPAGGSLAPEKHLYEELVYIVSGHGATEVWNGTCERRDGPPSFFEWQEGSLFVLPLNACHRLNNASGSTPVRFLAVTSAPLVLDLFHSESFIFNSDHVFTDRYAGEMEYFRVEDRRLPRPDGRGMIWETNFIPDVRGAAIDAYERKGAGVQLTVFEMGGNVLIGHLAEWPVGKYHKAHFHGGGAVLLIVRSRGYTLMWPQEAGVRPYESGRADAVVKVDWQEGSVLSPPSGWFHQHFNTGPEPARQLAIRYGSNYHDIRFWTSQGRGEKLYTSVKQGGALIEYADEDPQIRRLFTSECAKNGVKVQMA